MCIRDRSNIVNPRAHMNRAMNDPTAYSESSPNGTLSIKMWPELFKRRRLVMNVSELVTKAKMGDVDAFTELVRRYQAMAFGYAYSRIGDFHLAEDAVQQAFIAAWHGLPRLKQPERFGGWLRSIVRFECSHLLRARRLQLSINDAQGILESEEPAQLVEEQEDLDRVIAAVNNLAETEREVTILYYIHDHSQREVAEFLNLPVTTVNNRLRSARNHLKEGRSLTMANEALKEHRLPKEFASRIGEIVRSQGPIVDARFAPEQRPRVLSELSTRGRCSGANRASTMGPWDRTISPIRDANSFGRRCSFNASLAMVRDLPSLRWFRALRSRLFTVVTGRFRNSATSRWEWSWM